MIIKSSKIVLTNAVKKKQTDNLQKAQEKEKPVIRENNCKKKNKKIISTPTVEETSVVKEEIKKEDDIDLSEWLKEEDIDD